MKINLRLFAAGTGAFPVHNNTFKIGTKGRLSVEPTDFVVIKGLENFAPAIDSNIEEYYPMEEAGWIKRMLTGKALGIGFSGKRIYGDPGNDYVADMLMKTGQDCETILQWVFASGAKLDILCIINLTTPAGGDTINIDTLEFEVMSDGKPTFTPAA
jgi:hypothetical protein